MKRRILSLALVLALVFGALPAVQAAPARLPIYVGDLQVDYMAEVLLSQMDLSGKSDLEKIQTVYEWIIRTSTRDPADWDGTYYFDPDEVAAAVNNWFRAEYEAKLASGRILLRQNLRDLCGIPNTEPGNWDSDSNYYIIGEARNMMLKRNGHCGSFSSLLAVLLGHLGYDTRLVYGEFESKFGGEPVVHTWNYILLDGTFYWADVRIDHSNVTAGYAGHSYFMIADTDVWDEEHNWDHTYSDWLAANALYFELGYWEQVEQAPTPWENCSDWARDYMQRAGQAGLIPSRLEDQDLRNPITRAEFAAVAAGLYEFFRGSVPEYPFENPFSDTQDPDVLRAYGLGIVNGMGDGTFAPDALLTREQAVTMLGRVYELADTNAVHSGVLLPQSVLQFSDHSRISDYARNYVYFFVGQSIVDGMGNGTFEPQSSMTREQALKVAVESAARLVLHDYGEDPAPAPAEE